MTTQVLEEKPSIQTTSEADSTQVSEPERELPDDSVQPNSEPESDSQETEDSSRPDPRTTRLQALADAEREEAEQSGYQKAVAELTGNTEAQQKEQQKQKVRQAHTTTLATIDNVLARAVDEYGSPRALTVAEAGQIKAAQNEYHKVAVDAGYDAAADDVRSVAYGMLPTKAAQEQFTELTKGETDLPTYLNHWAETAALHTKAVKAMTLEDAEKASSKIKRELAARDLKQYDDGREQGRIDPPGTSPDSGRSSQRSAPGMKTFIELENKYADGSANKAETAEYLRLRDQRAKSR